MRFWPACSSPSRAGLADRVAATLVFVVGRHISDRRVQPHSVVFQACPVEFEFEFAGVADLLQVRPLTLHVPEQGLDPGLIGRRRRAPEQRAGSACRSSTTPPRPPCPASWLWELASPAGRPPNQADRAQPIHRGLRHRHSHGVFRRVTLPTLGVGARPWARLRSGAGGLQPVCPSTVDSSEGPAGGKWVRCSRPGGVTLSHA